MRPVELLASAVLFSSLSSAWPSGWEAAKLLERDIEPLVRRQDATTKNDLSYTGVEGNTATTIASSSDSDSSATQTGDSTQTTDGSASQTGSATGSQQSSGTATQTATGTNTKSGSGSKTTTFSANLPAGGISMITPNVYSTSYYKIDDWVTFAWNYTSLSITPSYIDVLASCSLNQETYTIALNQSVQPTQTILWDTKSYQANATVPLLTETYTLIVYDAASSVSAAAQAGYLGTYDQFTFGMYVPQPYTPIADYICATCNSALSRAERQTLWAVFGMVGLTVLSFGWFTGVAGLW